MVILEEGHCLPLALIIVNVFLASIDGVIAALAFYQLTRIHNRSRQLGWTRQKVLKGICMRPMWRVVSAGSTSSLVPKAPQFYVSIVYTSLMVIIVSKVFHLMIGSSNVGYFVYFVSTLIATCKGWLCWSHACGFVLIAYPKILFLAAFLLLLSFWVDLCHQSNDEEDEDDNSPQHPLLEKKPSPGSSNINDLRRCCPWQAIHVGSRQKFVILVIVLVFLLMMAFAVLIWIGMGKNPIDSSIVARVYTDIVAIAIILLGGALATYGLLLFSKMSKVRSDQASSDMWKVAGLAIVSVVCFTSSAVVALVTDVPVLYLWNPMNVNALKTSLLIIVYYLLGSSVPSAFVLWIMRDMPPPLADTRQAQSTTVTFITDRPAPPTHHTHRWTDATCSQNQVSRASPI